MKEKSFKKTVPEVSDLFQLQEQQLEQHTTASPSYCETMPLPIVGCSVAAAYEPFPTQIHTYTSVRKASKLDNE